MDRECNQKPHLHKFLPVDKATPSISKNLVHATSRTEKQVVKIQEVCEGTSDALQELRHGIIYLLFETLDMIDLNTNTLAIRIEESIHIVKDLKQRETDRLTTERLIEILEKLRPQLQP